MMSDPMDSYADIAAGVVHFRLIRLLNTENEREDFLEFMMHLTAATDSDFSSLDELMLDLRSSESKASLIARMTSEFHRVVHESVDTPYGKHCTEISQEFVYDIATRLECQRRSNIRTPRDGLYCRNNVDLIERLINQTWEGGVLS